MPTTILLIIFLFVLIVVVGTAAWAGIRAAPFVPSRGRDVQRIMRLSEIKPGETFVDCGCGDGRLVLAAAALGAQLHGGDGGGVIQENVGVSQDFDGMDEERPFIVI